MLRMPVFCWTMLVTCLMVVTLVPALLVAMAHGRRQPPPVFSSTATRSSTSTCSGSTGTRAVYVMFFPFVGRGGRGRPHLLRPAGSSATGRWCSSLLAFAALSMSVWAHHMFTTGLVANEYFALTSTALRDHRGRRVLRPDRRRCGRASSVRPRRAVRARGSCLRVPDRRADRDHRRLAPAELRPVTTATSSSGTSTTRCSPAACSGLLAGIYYWFPKFTGTLLLPSGWGRIQFVLTGVGTNLAFFPMLVLGYDGMAPPGCRLSPRQAASETWNAISHRGRVGDRPCRSQVFLLNIVLSLARGVPAGDDPWGGADARVGHILAATAPRTSAASPRSARTRRCSTCARSQRDDGAPMACAGSWGRNAAVPGRRPSPSGRRAVLQAAPLLLAGAAGLVIAALAARGRWMAVPAPRRAAATAAVGLTLALLGIVAGLWPHADRRGGGAGRDRDGPAVRDSRRSTRAAVAGRSRRRPLTSPRGARPGFHEHLTGQMAGQAVATSLAAAALRSVRARAPPAPGVGVPGSVRRPATVLFHLPGSYGSPSSARGTRHRHGRPAGPPPSRSTGPDRPLTQTTRLPGPARLPYALLGMIPAEAVGLAMMASDTAWQTAAAVMMAGSVTIGLIGLASTWSWLTAELGEGGAGG